MSLKRSFTLLNLPTSLRSTTCSQCRHLHRLNAPTLPVPKPTPFVPDVQTFLTLIGRGLNAHTSKIPSWEALFTLSSEQLKESGVEPARARRYLLWWRERFRNGVVGVGGDLEHVKDGVGELKIVEVPSERGMDRFATLSKDAGMRKVIVNTPPSSTSAESSGGAKEAEEEDGDEAAVHAHAPPPKMDAKEAKPVMGMRIYHGSAIGGKGVQPLKGNHGVAVLKVQEGLWEQRRGHKVDGGERRQAEVRAKRRVQERKNAR